MSAIEVRCKSCNRLLCIAEVIVAAIKCPKCYKIFEYNLYSNITMSNSYDPTETKKRLEDIR